MWLLVQVARGSKYFDPDSRVDNRVLICDSGELTISGRSSGDGAYRFEARRGTENFSFADFKGLAARRVADRRVQRARAAARRRGRTAQGLNSPRLAPRRGAVQNAAVPGPPGRCRRPP